ncbi:B9 protein domain 1 [Trypanosoma grayi]|uniref:B9 protein domain 1 n=1 Tax=Trypanosoma grayi TaxID=71804 RepID=UPI0004F45890|nr:B9 protein domain 1 [Trypanosoma grayi]KEG12666.1 B9 protein domain 1 [Trypanosoma grayi]
MDDSEREGRPSTALPRTPRDDDSPPRHRHHRRSKRASLVPPPATTSVVTSRGFDVIVRGVLEGAECHEADTLFARTYWVHGSDWTPLTSVTRDALATGESPLVRPLDRETQSEVITQLSCRSEDPFSRFTWAAPFECALHSTNPHGWPQLVVTLHTVSRVMPTGKVPHQGGAGGGWERCVSYSRCFIPMRSGTYRKKLPLMQLVPNTRKLWWISWWTGERLELRDPAFLCSGEDRGVLSAAPLAGHVALSLSVVVSGLAECGIEM